jgi:hypothetical protein
MLVTLEGIVTFTRLVQLAKAPDPMLVKVLGMDILTRLVQP